MTSLLSTEVLPQDPWQDKDPEAETPESQLAGLVEALETQQQIIAQQQATIDGLKRTPKPTATMASDEKNWLISCAVGMVLVSILGVGAVYEWIVIPGLQPNSVVMEKF